MPCYHPVRVSILRKARPSGGRRIRDTQVVPCGRCLGCRAEQARQWAVRISHEARCHESAWFVTLTYDDAFLPEHGSLVPSDFRNFIRALRRSQDGKISYYGCGEYGPYSSRPHYHAVLFGADFSDQHLWRRSANGDSWRSASLERAWRFGHSEFGAVTWASASYVAGYVRKKVAAQENPEYYLRVSDETGEIVEVQPEFSRMSLRPALGKRWIEKYWKDVYPRDYVVIEGVKAKPPRYYDKWMDQNHPDVMADVREARWDPEKDDSKENRLAKEAHHAARLKLFNQRVQL